MTVTPCKKKKKWQLVLQLQHNTICGKNRTVLLSEDLSFYGMVIRVGLTSFSSFLFRRRALTKLGFFPLFPLQREPPDSRTYHLSGSLRSKVALTHVPDHTRWLSVYAARFFTMASLYLPHLGVLGWMSFVKAFPVAPAASLKDTVPMKDLRASI